MIDAHRGAFEYDWRTRFSQEHGLGIVGKRQSWGEAIRMYRILANDPTSQICAALAGWDFPIDRTTMAVLDLFDLTVRAHSDRKSRPKPHHGRPFDMKPAQGASQIGNTEGRSRADVVAYLNSLGHHLPIEPTREPDRAAQPGRVDYVAIARMENELGIGMATEPPSDAEGSA